MEITGLQLALIVLGSVTVGTLIGWFMAALCVMAGRADECMNRSHWMEQE